MITAPKRATQTRSLVYSEAHLKAFQWQNNNNNSTAGNHNTRTLYGNYAQGKEEDQQHLQRQQQTYELPQGGRESSNRWGDETVREGYHVGH